MNLGTTTTITKIGQTWYAKTYKNDINVSSIVGSYIIDKNTLISSFKGIKKIRLELSPDNYDKEFSKDKVGIVSFREPVQSHFELQYKEF